jgi:hypothetical protein
MQRVTILAALGALLAAATVGGVLAPAASAAPTAQVIASSGTNTLIRAAAVEPDSGPCVDTGANPGCPTAEPEPDFSGQPWQFADGNADNGNGNPAYPKTFPGSRWVSLTGSDGADATSGFGENPHWVEYDQVFDRSNYPGKGVVVSILADNEVTGLYINGVPFSTCSQSAPCFGIAHPYLEWFVPYLDLRAANNELMVVTRNYGYGLTAGGIDLQLTTYDPPTETITAPIDGATFALNQVVHAQFSCGEGAVDPQPVVECYGVAHDPVEDQDFLIQSGDPIPTWAAGTLPFKVVGRDQWGTFSVTTIHYTVARADQTITFPQVGPFTFGDPPAQLNASATSNGVIAYSVTSGPCSIVNASQLALDHAGTCVVEADQSGGTNWNPAPPVSISVVVNKADQTVAFTSTPPAQPVAGGAPYPVSATASSGLPASFSVAPGSAGVCSISGSTVSLLAGGTCTIAADQAGNADYNAAPQVTQSFTVNKAPTTLVAAAVKKKLLSALRLRPLTFAATLSRSDTHAAVAGGRVSFSVGGHVACTATTNVSGVASCQADISLIGGLLANSYTASFAGDAVYLPSKAIGKLSF